MPRGKRKRRVFSRKPKIRVKPSSAAIITTTTINNDNDNQERDEREEEEEEEEKNVIRTIQLGEIWAFPLESDGYPRSYGRIDRIIPLPFPSFLHVTLLDLHPVTHEEMLCSENALPIPCGMFRISNSTLTKPLTAFSHRVPTEPDPPGPGFYRIFPQKGQVWALYDRYIDAKKGFEHRLVEVVSDYSGDVGVDVAKLVEVESDDTDRAPLHRRQLVQERFSKRSLFVFSHRVPASRIVLGGKNFWEVVEAASPPVSKVRRILMCMEL